MSAPGKRKGVLVQLSLRRVLGLSKLPCHCFSFCSAVTSLTNTDVLLQNLQAVNSTCKEVISLCLAETANLEMLCVGGHSCESCEPKLKQQCFRAGTSCHSCSPCTCCPPERHHLTGKHQKRTEKEKTFRRQFIEKPSIILGCPGR
jgi:hypothetical protein